MIKKLPFYPSSCYHDFQYYSIFYGEPYLHGEHIYYYDGFNLRICGYNKDGSPISNDYLKCIIDKSIKKWKIKTVTVDCPSIRNIDKYLPNFRKTISHYPNRRFDFEIIVKKTKYKITKRIKSDIQKAKNKGTFVVLSDERLLTWYHYLLIDKFTANFKDSSYYKAEFITSIFYLLQKDSSFLLNCYCGDQLRGFALVNMIGDFGIFHILVTGENNGGVSDLIYSQVIDSLFSLGAKEISLGFSLKKGLLNFKMKWCSEKRFRGGYEMNWCLRYRDYLWATYIARRR